MKKNILLLGITVMLIIIYIFMPTMNTKEVIRIEKESSQIAVKVLNKDGNIVNIDLEEYIIGVVAAEMPASFHIEALKAQAIASRSYAMYKINNNSTDYHVTTDVTTQSYITIDEMKDKWGIDFEYYYTKIKDAVTDTNNKVMKYNEEIICAFYFSTSNGYTEDSITVFDQELGYIKSVESKWDENVNNFEVINTVSKEEFCSKLDIACSTIIINDIKYSDSNRVENITINNKKVIGTAFRTLFNLRSTDFAIDISNEVIITTKGYGHGVGMSQYGANEMANISYNYEEILKHYYNNIEINQI